MPLQDSDESNWFIEHLQPHEDMLRAWLESRFPPHCDIDDIIQDAYLRVLDARKKDKLRSPKAFLFATARNLAIDRLRHIKVAKNESLVENDLSRHSQPSHKAVAYWTCLLWMLITMVSMT